MIYNEREIREQQVIEAAKQMMTAARTAPKAKGEDLIEEIKEGQKQTYPISSFVSECVETKPSSFVRYGVLGKAFAEWCKKNNVESSIPDSRELFGNIKEQHSMVESKKRGGHRGVLGIALKNQ